MEKVGLLYGTTTVKTDSVAKKIKEKIGKSLTVNVIPVENASKKDIKSYNFLIIGTSTWFDGELPSYWDEILPELEEIDFKGKKVAIFGLGDQINYPDNFVDGIGMLADFFESRGAYIIGTTLPDGYAFNRSRALKNGKIQGLAIDIENQDDRTDKRIDQWVDQIKKEMTGE